MPLQRMRRMKIKIFSVLHCCYRFFGNYYEVEMQIRNLIDNAAPRASLLAVAVASLNGLAVKYCLMKP